MAERRVGKKLIAFAETIGGHMLDSHESVAESRLQSIRQLSSRAIRSCTPEILPTTITEAKNSEM